MIAIAVSTAMHGLIGVDAELRPLTPPITWADARARAEAPDAARLQAGDRAASARRHARVLDEPLTKLMWLHGHEPRICQDARWWLGLKD